MILSRHTLAQIIPPLCRLVRLPDVQACLPADPAADMQPLALAMLRHPAESIPVLAGMTDLNESILRMLPPGADLPLMRCSLEEGLCALMHLCGQCTADELLAALSRCTFTPDPAMLSALVSRDRTHHAQKIYGLQLLWRMLGDDRIPDALSLFDPDRKEVPHG